MGAMKRVALGILFCLSLAIAACGMGGTEVGNPRPGMPAAGEASGDDQAPTAAEASPSPSPSAIEFDEETELDAAELAE